MGFGAFDPRQIHHLSAPGDSDRQSRYPASFSHSGDVLRVVVHAVTVQRTADAQEKLDSVTEIVSDRGRLRPVVRCSRHGIDEGDNETHKPGGVAEIIRLTFPGRYPSDRFDGPVG